MQRHRFAIGVADIARKMLRIAHLSDPHLLAPDESRSLALRARLSFLSFGRPLDAASRRARFVGALRRAIRHKVDHIVVTGDLTEDGTPAQFEVLASALRTSGVNPDRVTLVPGNHDAYHDPAGFCRALAGPLRAFGRHARHGSIAPVGHAVIASVHTTMGQSVLRSAGRLRDGAIKLLASLASKGGPVIAAMHHPPLRHRILPWQWIDGLEQADALTRLLRSVPHLHVLHGHSHLQTSRAVSLGERSRVFGVRALAEHPRALRYYAIDGLELSCFEPEERGQTLPSLRRASATAPAA